MFRTSFLPIIRSSLLYIRHWYISYRFWWPLPSRFRVELNLLGSGHLNWMKYTSAECTVENSWWWAERMRETC